MSLNFKDSLEEILDIAQVRGQTPIQYFGVCRSYRPISARDNPQKGDYAPAALS